MDEQQKGIGRDLINNKPTRQISQKLNKLKSLVPSKRISTIMDTPIMDKIEEGITNAATAPVNDLPSKEEESREHALEKAEREFERDRSPNKERIEDANTVKYHKNKDQPGTNLNEE